MSTLSQLASAAPLPRFSRDFGCGFSHDSGHVGGPDEEVRYLLERVRSVCSRSASTSFTCVVRLGPCVTSSSVSALFLATGPSTSSIDMRCRWVAQLIEQQGNGGWVPYVMVYWDEFEGSCWWRYKKIQALKNEVEPSNQK